MLHITKINPMVRAIGTVGAVAALVGGITFAQFQTNTVALTANELDVTNHTLQISNGGAFGDNAVGFHNSNLIIGNEGPKQAFYLQNLANDPVAISVNIPSAPAGTNLDLTKVLVNFYDFTGAHIASPTVAALEAGSQSLNTMPALAQGNGGSAVPGNYTYSITVQSGAATGASPTVPNFDLDFTGTE